MQFLCWCRIVGTITAYSKNARQKANWETKRILRIIPQKFVNRMLDDLNISLRCLRFPVLGISVEQSHREHGSHSDCFRSCFFILKIYFADAFSTSSEIFFFRSSESVKLFLFFRWIFFWCTRCDRYFYWVLVHAYFEILGAE